jgi:DNA polymerase-1
VTDPAVTASSSDLLVAPVIHDAELVEPSTALTQVNERHVGLNDLDLHLIDSMEEVGNFLRWLSTDSVKEEVAFDTECTGLDKDVDRVRLAQFGDERSGWAIPFERWGGVVEDVVRRYTGRYVTHNGPAYDVPMMRREGIELPRDRVDDTRIMLHVLESTGSTALKTAATRLIDPRAATMQKKLDEAIGKKGGWTWATVPITFEPYWVYACVDTILTKQLKNILKPRVDAEAPDSYELELAVIWVTEAMERRGVRVDREYTQDLADKLTAYINEVERWCAEHYGIWPGANQKIIDILTRDGVEFTKLTSGGNISLDAEVLAGIDHPLASAVLGRRKAQKSVSTYLLNYLKMSERDGRIHPSINTIGGIDKNPYEPGGGKGVRTGRMSMGDPNLQNVPTRTNAGKRIRNCFIPSEGNVWVKCDADQIEMRLLAHLSGDPGLVAAFHAEGDFFVNMGRRLFNEPDFQKSDPRRQFIKNGGYAWIYGAGDDKFAKTAGVAVAEASEFMRTMNTTYSGVGAWKLDLERTARQNYETYGEAFVRSPFTGRKLVADSVRRLYTLVNYSIQCSAAEQLKRKIVQADQAGLGKYMLIPVHDEIDFDVPKDELNDFMVTLNDVMNDADVLRVPMTWSAEIGPRWGECVEPPRELLTTAGV